MIAPVSNRSAPKSVVPFSNFDLSQLDSVDAADAAQSPFAVDSFDGAGVAAQQDASSAADTTGADDAAKSFEQMIVSLLTNLFASVFGKLGDLFGGKSAKTGGVS